MTEVRTPSKTSLFDRPSSGTKRLSLFDKPISTSSSSRTLAEESNQAFPDYPDHVNFGAPANYTGSPAAKKASFSPSTTTFGASGLSDHHSALEESEAPAEMSTGWPQGHSSVPLAIALLPPLLATFIPQKSEVWGDLFAMFLVAYYLHFIISVPYELYQKARQRSPNSQTLEATLEDYPDIALGDEVGADERASLPASVRAVQDAAELELSRWQVIYLLLYLASPAIAGFALKVAKDHLFSATGPIVKQLNIGVFVFVAALRPLGELVELLRERTLYLKKEVATPVTEVDVLMQRIATLESAVETIQREVATREEVQLVKDQVVGPSLDKIARSVRKVERRESSKTELDEQRFKELERRLMESEERVKKLHEGRGFFSSLSDEDGAARVGSLGFLFGYIASVVDVLFWPWKVASGVIKLISGGVHIQKWSITGYSRKAMIEGGSAVKEE
ncbi:hypothetical protein M427DRAFT_51037 [Gonapodya prolifera JEL478]|uniref:Uncharacterized protein n=1 Tax=Gonapodya prolifera (strain JEL478) TaxID=1344416 RepID=A0A139AXZ6_GONPJ|nr:hypothetical protein M427DRAFT_51037 [Gonapodya prolifera JEL478]|eukprot:KXS21616.1 hypothetical protein M427DRAFT_51037 [Gonapodya prolifera JEL478]